MSAYTQNIHYGAVVFPYTRLRVEQTPVFASNGATHEGTEFVFSITGWLTASSPDTLDDLICAMRSELTTRGSLFKVYYTPGPVVLYSFDGLTTVNLAHDNTASIDDRWGPIPGKLTVDRFTGGCCAAYSWSCSVFVKECYASSCTIAQPRNPRILSITTNYGFKIDVDGMTTRTVSGKLKVSARTVAEGLPADSFRNEINVPIPPNFRRTGYDFQQDETGCVLSYTVTDEECLDILPDPITGGDVDWSVRIADTGMLAQYSLSGYFTAPRSVSKDTLLARLFTLIEQRFPTKQKGFVFEEREITTNLLKNRVTFRITATAAIGQKLGQLDFRSGILDTIGKRMSKTAAHFLGPYGGDLVESSGVTAAVPNWTRDACDAGTEPPTKSKVKNQKPGTASSSNADQNVQKGTDNGASQAHQDAPYLAFHEEIHYEVDNGLVMYTPKSVKDNGARNAAFAVQARVPSVMVIQAGYCTRYAQRTYDASTVPPPILLGANANSALQKNACLISATIAPSEPEPVGSGEYNRYTIHWRYVMALTKALDKTSDVGFQFPIDPRRPATDDTDTTDGTGVNGMRLGRTGVPNSILVASAAAFGK